jgi:hypothetical protein
MNLKLVVKQIQLIVFMLVLFLGVSTPAGTAPAHAAPAPNIILPAAVYSWTKTWGGASSKANASSLAVDALGNVFVAGQYQGTVDFDPAHQSAQSIFTSTKGTVDAFLTKFNAAGAYQWTRVWGSGSDTDIPCILRGCGRDAANGVGVDNLGNAYVSGLFHNTVDMGNGIVIISNAPSSNSAPGGYNNIMAAKFSSDGATLWARAWGGTTGGESYSLAVDAAHQAVYVTGDWSTGNINIPVDFNPSGIPQHDLHTNHGAYDAFVSKFDLNGNFQWAKTWGGLQYDDSPGVAVDPFGNVIVAGMYGSQNIDFDPAGLNPAGRNHPASDSSMVLVDIFLTKFTADGTWLWVRTWGGQGTEDAGGPVAVDQAGNIYAGGRFSATNCNFKVGANGPIVPGAIHSTTGSFDAFVSKFSPDGTFQWVDTWGGPNADASGQMAMDSSQNLYVGGSTDGVRDPKTYVYTSSKGMLRKMSPNGAYQWEKDWGTGGSNLVWMMNPVMDNTDNLYLLSSFQGTVDFNPGGGADSHSAYGSGDSSLTLFSSQSVVINDTLYLPLIKK